MSHRSPSPSLAPRPAVVPRVFLAAAVVALAALAAALTIPAAAVAADRAGDLAIIVLPAPETSGGMPLLSAIAARRSQRAFAPDPLPLPVLSTLLWAAWGVTRPETGHRAAPSAHNRQATDLYVVLAEGTYRYDAQDHALVPIVAGDLRPLTGRQDFVTSAPVNLVFVERLPADVDESTLIWAGSHAGFISENVYLYCASAGLATVVRGWVDGEALAEALGLPTGHRVLLAQTVGYPAN
jgi:nitroreductase